MQLQTAILFARKRISSNNTIHERWTDEESPVSLLNLFLYLPVRRNRESMPARVQFSLLIEGQKCVSIHDGIYSE